MINKSSLKRVTHYAGAFLFAGALVGCGDDGGGGGGIDAAAPDAGAIDAAAPDACVGGGHACGEVGTPFALGEGGEFRLERLQLSADGSAFYLASQAFFFKGQEPAARSLGSAETTIPIRAEIMAEGYRCTDRRGGDLFENGASPEAQAIIDTREYYDVGASVTLTNTEDDTDVITLDRRQNEIDLSAHLMHDVIYRGPDEQDVARNRTYKPALTTGSAQYPQLDMTYGQSAAGEKLADENTGVGDVQLYMPSQFTLTSPTDVEYFTPDNLVFTKDQDFTFTYTAEDAPEGWPTILLFIAFVNAEGQVVASCLKTPTAEEPNPDNGSLKVPHEVLAIAEQESAGAFLVGRFVHTAWEYATDRTRVDLLGIECKAAAKWAIQEPTGN